MRGLRALKCTVLLVLCLALFWLPKIKCSRNLDDLSPVSKTLFGDSIIRKRLSGVLSALAGAGNNILKGVVFLPSRNGHRRAVIDARWRDSNQDALIEKDVGPVGYTHLLSDIRKHAEEVTATVDQRRVEWQLKELNTFIGHLGFPPLPYMPNSLTTNSTCQSCSQHDLLSKFREEIITKKKLPDDIISEFSGPEYESLRSSWSLPPTSMPRLNQGLAQSAWSTSHRTGYAQGSSPFPAPDGTKRLTHNFLNRALVTSNPITLFYSADHRWMWGSSWTTIFKVERTSKSLRVVDYAVKSAEKIVADKFHGAYALLTDEDIFIVSSGSNIEAYYDVPDTNGERIMMHPEVFDIGHAFASEKTYPLKVNEVVRALCMTGDGKIVWVTDSGRIGVIDRFVKQGSFRKVLDWIMLGSSTDSLIDIEVSNNIACDEHGGIFVVSSKFMHRVDWNGHNLRIKWEVPYDEVPISGETAPVRLGEGSGSTPTLMGDGKRNFVVITDSAKLMNVVVMNAQDGKIEARHPITFGNSAATETSSEQSVLVYGWRMVVVNNEPSESAKQQAQLLQLIGAPANALLRTGAAAVRYAKGSNSIDIDAPFGVAERISDTVINALPVIVGDAPKGAEQFEFDPDNTAIRVTWSNPDISIPNGIPTMSAQSQLMYGIGKRGNFGGDAAPLRGMWTLEAIDWWTGRSVFYYNIGMGPMSNSIYAATQVGPREIVTGTAAGVVRIMEYS